MKEATLCTWIETSDYSNQATVWSYATQSEDNEWFLAFTNPSTYHFLKRRSFDFNVERMTGVQKVMIINKLKKYKQFISEI